MHIRITSIALIILLCIAGIILPVIAESDRDWDSITDLQTYTLKETYGYTSSGDIARYMDNLYIKEKAFWGANELLQVSGTYSYPMVYPISCSGTCTNSSSKSVYLVNATGYVFGSGTLGYSVDMSNHINVYLNIVDWDMEAIRTGYILYNALYFSTTPAWPPTHGAFNLQIGSGYPMYWGLPTYDWFTAFTYLVTYPVPSDGNTITYRNFMHTDYSIARDGITDTYTITRNDGASYVTIYQTVAGVESEIYSTNKYAPSVDTAFALNGTEQRMMIMNPVSGNAFWFHWDAATEEAAVTLDVEKGKTSDDYLSVMEETEAWFNTDVNPNDIGYVLWNWNEGSSTSVSGNPPYWHEYWYNTTSGTWQKYIRKPGEPLEDFDFNSEVKRQTIRYAYTEMDTNWTSTTSPHHYVRVALYDRDFNIIGEVQSIPIYVGNINLNPQTRFDIMDTYGHLISDGRLFVYDDTDATMLVNGELITTGQKLVNTPRNHDYVVWVNAINRSFICNWYDWNGPITTHTCASDGYSTGNFTVLDGGVKNDRIYMTYYTPPGSYRMVTFNVVDYTNHNPIDSASIRIKNITAMAEPYESEGYDNTWTTNAYGYKLVDLPGYAYEYNYYVSKDGYNTIGGNFTAQDGMVITIELVPYGVVPSITPTPIITTVPTTTVPTTFIPTQIPTGPSGLPQVNLAQMIMDLFMSFGLSASNARLFAGMFFVFCGAVIAASLVPHPIVIMTGGYAGFILAFLTGVWPPWIFISISAFVALAIAYAIFGRE